MNRRLCGTLLLIWAMLWAGGVLPQHVLADGGSHAGLVVSMGGGEVVNRCVAFDGSKISGYDLLLASGLDVEAVQNPGLGAAICSIEGKGCPTSKCLTCADNKYWSYWHWEDGAWVYSQIGASGYSVHDGDIEGWAWGAGDPPPKPDGAALCPAAATATPTATFAPPTPTPSATWTPSITPSPTLGVPPEVWLEAEHDQVAPGECTWVAWRAEGAEAVYFDEVQVDPRGQAQVCPQPGQIYALRAVNAGSESVITLTIAVATPLPTTSPTAATTESEPTSAAGAEDGSETASPAGWAATAAASMDMATASATTPATTLGAGTPGAVAEAAPTPEVTPGAADLAASAGQADSGEVVMPALGTGGRLAVALIVLAVAAAVAVRAWRRHRS